MKPKHYLVVGASSVAGQKAIEAIRAKDANAKITVTTSKSAGTVSSPSAVERTTPFSASIFQNQNPSAI
jgi:hypothetical protein